MTRVSSDFWRGVSPRWPLVKLGELSSDESAFADGPFGSNLKTEHYRPSGARVVRLQNIGSGSFLDDDKVYIALDHFKRLQRHSVRPSDIVVAALGSGARPAGRSAMIPDGFGLGIVKADCFRVRLPNTSVYAPFLLQLMNSWPFLRQVAMKMRGATRPRMTLRILRELVIPLPTLPEQERIAATLRAQMDSVDHLRVSAESSRGELAGVEFALLRDSLSGSVRSMRLKTCLSEVNNGVGSDWGEYPVLGATRAGLSPAKESVGKNPTRYKLVDSGTVFYNPMRILLGSIAMVDEGDPVGITSPDYVVFKCIPDVLHYRWFYYWLRSPLGERFIKGLTRGAVRERLLFRRLAEATIELPSIAEQRRAAENLSWIRRAREKVTAQITAIEALPAAYLHRAFSGSV